MTGYDDGIITIGVIIIIIIIIIIFLTPVGLLNSQGMKKLRYAIQKSTKINGIYSSSLLLLLLHETVMQ